MIVRFNTVRARNPFDIPSFAVGAVTAILGNIVTSNWESKQTSQRTLKELIRRGYVARRKSEVNPMYRRNIQQAYEEDEEQQLPFMSIMYEMEAADWKRPNWRCMNCGRTVLSLFLTAHSPSEADRIFYRFLHGPYVDEKTGKPLPLRVACGWCTSRSLSNRQNKIMDLKIDYD